jgi:hypothetical protein
LVDATQRRRSRQRPGEQLTLIVHPAVKQGIRELAAKDAITMAAWIERTLETAVRAAGYAVDA